MKELIDSLVTRSKAEAANASTRLRFGPILEVDGRMVTIRLAGVVIPNVPCADHVDPAVDKQAWILQQGNMVVGLLLLQMKFENLLNVLKNH